MQAGLRFLVVALAFFGALSQSSAAPKKSAQVSASSITICDDAQNGGLCLIEPLEAPETVILREETTAAPSMVTENELSGGAVSVESEALLALAVNPLDLQLRPEGALSNAQDVNDKVRSIEQHLQSAAPEGDLTVISAGEKKK